MRAQAVGTPPELFTMTLPEQQPKVADEAC